ncbi:hypothetical protein AHF37_07204 [Paragonimus kellicotti]|nr:hypothetical protein AHF37_07204 [Paragonimus kellicotti]
MHGSLPSVNPAWTSVLPSDLVFFWPQESTLIARMLSSNPSHRPSASKVLHCLAASSEFPDLVHRQSVPGKHSDECDTSTVQDLSLILEHNDDQIRIRTITSPSSRPLTLAQPAA